MTTSEPVEDAIAKPHRSTPKWIVAIVFALVYAFIAFEGLSNLIGLLQSFAALNAALTPGAVAALAGLVVVPLLVFAIILWLSRRATPLKATLMYIVGLGAVSVLTLDLQNLFQQLL